MRKTAVMMNDLFLEHDTGYGHVESAERLRIIYDRLNEPEERKKFIFPSFQPASYDDIHLIHTEEHIKRVASTAEKYFDLLDPDTVTSPRSYDAACLAAGALIAGTRLLVEGEADNCFALVRPPGHHAEKTHSMGFCLFNNTAIAAQYALSELRLNRILIVDWDLHHGNGTQNSFYDTDQVLYFSTHQYPYFPGTGAAKERGKGKGLGFTVNVPLPGGQGDAAYARIFNSVLVPIARQYQPEMIIVSAGFDIFRDDPLGTMNVSIDGFAYMTRLLLNLADELCGGKLLLALEGGYDLAGERDGVMAVLNEMAGNCYLQEEIFTRLASSSIFVPGLDEAQKIAKKNWKL